MKKVVVHMEFTPTDKDGVDQMTQPELIASLAYLIEHEHRGLAEYGSVKVIQLQVQECENKQVDN